METLLEAALAIERELGRDRGADSARDAPRTIDVDLLFAGDERHSTARLTLPHPRLRERRFVLAPLADLVPGLVLAPTGATVAQLLASLPPRPAAERIGPRPEPLS